MRTPTAAPLGASSGVPDPTEAKTSRFSLLDTGDAPEILRKAENRVGATSRLWPGGRRENSREERALVGYCREKSPRLGWVGGMVSVEVARNTERPPTCPLKATAL